MAKVGSNRRSPYWAALVIVALALPSSSVRAEDPPSEQTAECMCSMISLIANPDRYDGKRVRTEGFAIVQFEGSAIYLSKESAENAVGVNGIGLSIASAAEAERLKGLVHAKWVLVEGIYHKWQPGETGSRGYMDDITLLYAPEDAKIVE